MKKNKNEFERVTLAIIAVVEHIMTMASKQNNKT